MSLIFSDPIQAPSVCENKSDMKLICVILTVIRADRSDISFKNVTFLYFNEENKRTQDSELCAKTSSNSESLKF